ncbi:MAG TPA: VOC family protein, partial [Candidatus Limnocylindria bacterium]|nr:VOC family protein [Candidatus Limnocylindria bacterium]
MNDPSPAAFEGLSSIGQVRIAVHDIDRAVAFYRDTLGMPFLFQFPGMAFFDLNGTRLMVVDPESRDFGGESVIY